MLPLDFNGWPLLNSCIKMWLPVLALAIIYSVQPAKSAMLDKLDGIYKTSTLCTYDMPECEFWLVAEEKFTMIQGKAGYLNSTDGKLFKLNKAGVFDKPLDDAVNYIQADGYRDPPRLVYVFNGSMPGPTIEVYEGQSVIVHFKNSMKSESSSIHWHGMHQRESSFMDGVAFISQCPVLPGQDFKYRFIADPEGTHWYHAHIGAQRTNGLFGAFIVHPSNKTKSVLDHIMVLNDWNHDWESNMGQLLMLNGIVEGSEIVTEYQSIGTSRFSAFKFQSGLINGKGRHWTSPTEHNGAPLHEFHVKRDELYRFRCINAGTIHPFRIWIEDHSLRVLASDGYEIQQEVVQSVIINPGERYDFQIIADRPTKVYFVMAETLTEDNVNPSLPPQRAEAYLVYEGSSDPVDLTTTLPPPETCSVLNKCAILNCPFAFFPGKTSVSECKDFSDIKGVERIPNEYTNGPIEELFYNFAFPKDPVTNNTPGTINGRAFVHQPYATYSVRKEDESDERTCDDGSCSNDTVCSCAHKETLKANKIYQIVFANIGAGSGFDHPVHIHGRRVYVVKVGSPGHDSKTGKLINENINVHEDLKCAGTKNLCNSFKWKIDDWAGGNLTEWNLDYPVLKDTFIIPSRGYVVVRFKTDNPGHWFMHCHIELHHLEGMAMYFEELSDGTEEQEPVGFPACNSFNYDRGLTRKGGEDPPIEQKATAARSSGPLSGYLFTLMFFLPIININY